MAWRSTQPIAQAEELRGYNDALGELRVQRTRYVGLEREKHQESHVCQVVRERVRGRQRSNEIEEGEVGLL